MALDENRHIRLLVPEPKFAAGSLLKKIQHEHPLLPSDGERSCVKRRNSFAPAFHVTIGVRHITHRIQKLGNVL